MAKKDSSDKDIFKELESFLASPASTKWDEDSTVDNKALQEQKLYFPDTFDGNLDKLDDWIRHEEFRLKKRDQDSERGLREQNATRAFWFSVGWALFIALVVSSKLFCLNTGLTELEYITTIGSLSITILTYYLVVIKHLFNKGVSNGKDAGTKS